MALVDMGMDSSSFPSSSSSATARWNYDVFLSFRGDDTHYNFVGHLYEALIQKGVHTFKDDKNLDRGNPISPELLKAIEKSRIAIIIISKDYASSAWCLDELTHIIHCKNETGMTVLPVFHYVDSSDVRKQMGTFEQAFIEHEEKENEERVEKWRDALRQVGNLSGCHLENSRYEIEDIKDIMGWISLHLKYDAFPYIARNLVGIYSRTEELESLLAIGSNDVRFIGVWGMGGMGKTTLARVVYYMVSKEFEVCSFIEDVRENSEKHGLVGLQQKLISNILVETDLKIRDKYDGVLKIKKRLCRKRILLVLDDVNKLDQLKMLAGEHDWFGLGSRIIIITRDLHMLKMHGVDEIYEVKGLYDKDAFQLFCSKAFKKDHVPNEYLVMSEEFLCYAAGLPLVLEVLGSFLFEKSTNEWKSVLMKLKEYPNPEILNVLKISYDGLHDLEKEIFLHIACFFNQKETNYVVEVLDSLGLGASVGLKGLINKSLLKIGYSNILWMHDLLEEMGKNIFRQECLNDCGRRNTKILSVLKISYDGLQNLEKEIFLHIACFFNHKEKDHVVDILDSLGLYPVIGLNELINKSLLKIMDNNIVWMHDLLEEMGRDIVFQECPDDPRKRSRLWVYKDIDKVLGESKGAKAVQAVVIWGTYFEEQGATWNPDAFLKMRNLKLLKIDYIGHVPTHLPYNLRILDWTNYPLKSLRSSFQLGELRQLCLRQSKIEQLWIGLKKFDKLKFIDLTESKLIITPDFTGVPYLKKLVLESCKYLCELHPSIGILKKLVLLNLRNCVLLCRLPIKLKMESLITLELSGCTKLERIPEFAGNMECLQKLFLDDTNIMELPSSVGGLIGLKSLTLRGCENLVCLPSTICNLGSLECLNLFGCSHFDNLPENLGNVKGLKELDLSGTAIKELPSSIEHLTRLTLLTLANCKNLACLPSTICSLRYLECLDLFGCSYFDNLPMNLGNVKGLKMLDLSGTTIEELPSSIEHLTSLTRLTLADCKNLVRLPSTFCSLKSVECLDLSGCSNFDSLLENLGNVKGLKGLDLSGTVIKELPSSIEHLTRLTLLTLKTCKNLVCLPSSICSLKVLERLDLSGCSNFDNLPENLGYVRGLKMLDLSGTAIKELPSSIECLTSLTSLTLLNCYKLECLPNTTSGFTLRGSLNLSTCPGFKHLPENPWIIEGLVMLDLSKTAIEELPSSIERLTNLTLLTLRYCINLVHLPNPICNLKLLNSLDLFGCLKFENLPENIGNIKGLELLDLCWTAVKEVPSSIVLLKNLKQLNIRGWKLSEFYSLPKSLEPMGPSWTLSFSLPIIPPLRGIGLPSFLFDSLPRSPVSMGLLLPSLLGLQSLKYMHFGDCNLSSIPNDIGCLSSLERLNLSGNNFVSLPESISQLSNLQTLHLEGCKRLRSLENVPSTIDSVIAINCTSLERLPELHNYPFKTTIVPHLRGSERLNSHLRFQYVNCFKLIDNIQSGSNMAQGQSGRLPGFLHIIVPGGEIPQGFSYECMGHELNIQLPYCGCDEQMGIALCVVFLKDELQYYSNDFRLFCSFKVNGSVREFRVHSLNYGEVETPHLWLLYISPHYFNSQWGEIFGQVDANGFSKLAMTISTNKLKVVKIGIHLVYKQHAREDQGVIHYDIDYSASQGTRKKRSHDKDDGPGGFMADLEQSSKREGIKHPRSLKPMVAVRGIVTRATFKN